MVCPAYEVVPERRHERHDELYLRDKALNHHIIPIQGFAVLVLR